MIVLECPNCQSCFSAAVWNIAPHIGEDIPENIEEDSEFQQFLIEGKGSRFDCPDCEYAVTVEDMNVV